VVSVAAFNRSNDNDNNTCDPCCTSKCDADSVTGHELSGALRGSGFPVDAGYNLFHSELVENGVTDGLYENSETDLKNRAIEGGFMIIPNKLEFVLG
jgi:phosphate-selective porin OprO and OprP